MKKILIHQPAYHCVLLLVLLVLLTCSCKKEKISNTIPLQNAGNQSASSIRMFNFSGYPANMTVNNIPLTSYSNGNTGQGTPLGLSVFPTGMWEAGDDGSPFTLPNSLLNKDGKAHFILGGGLGGASAIDTTIVNNVAHPQDYYLLLNGQFRVIDRNNLPPTNPKNFRIRIINLGATTDPYGLNGPVSLTYSDGSQVDPALNNIALNASSGYVDIPYGTYQFKLFASDGAGIKANRQLAELPTIVRLDPCAPNVIQPQEGLTPRVRTFKPGGVYSLVITPNLMNYIGCDTYPAITYANSYRVITELDPGVNSTYARMQAVNAIPGKQITIKVDGGALGGQQPYIGSVTAVAAQQSTYQIFVQGNHHIQAIDQNGTVLAEGDLKLYPYDNYTIWAYNKSDGKPAVLFESNDMSGSIYNSSYAPNPQTGVVPDDGTNGIPRRGQYFYALESRFLNLSPDLPYATFTNDHQLFLPEGNFQNGDTMRYYSAYVNLASGIMPANNSSIIYTLQPVTGGKVGVYAEFNYLPKYIRAYQSSPGNLPEIPGTLLVNVAPVDVLQTFVSNQNLYSTPKYKVAETGIYTVALVGKTASGAQAAEKARIVVIKHNK
ncbi:hypothetical protein SAMN05216464_102544 [Mucilaginibacter pineti]|uniref:DUF4397 domain-containing protein n=1 Tax=Mucilaginibacter pineti TaxID=1391627 RepID=A0A1G6XKI6_9SPHI|nr:hypothetical protein [Mucilaginibacter pineti]SDD77837.1 hypothetical protein SAMN05216464_102544 [Mucilaginibacter pineti]